ncbi:MAG: hypothetical protein MUE68_05200 [Bacteroidetes bacterium]|nr:hypothetical protein [Bacteroidota bacterium]
MPTNRSPLADQNDKPFSPLRRARLAAEKPGFPDVGSILGYAVSAVMVAVGALVLAGYLVHQGVPEQFRWTFATVLILMGIYRFFMTQMRLKQRAFEREEDVS